ncbi:MAG TPA: lipoate--protein ligase family protein [Candidatus Anammoximicrobium sp.]|nr:lipoate--protein ligase family protein [Candidatus Anammoximicrobium sp.]
MECRLIIDQPADGAWNMALDEALLESAGRAGQGGCLRFYFWKEPTVSLGYFQRCADRQTHAASRGCPLVRRSTGGGAIVHDLELTYSFTTGIQTHVRSGLADYYDAFHGTLIQELAERGISARLCPAPPLRRQAEEPFLCFQRRAEGDVLIGDSKIAGSAQRRRHGALLQHGSVLLQRSVAAPELAGIAELSSVFLDPRELAECWAKRVAAKLGLTLRSDSSTGREKEAAERICRSQYAQPGWTNRR